MSGNSHLSTWISADTKQRFATAARRQGLSESALLKRLVEQMLASATNDATVFLAPAATRDARVTIRLVGEDRTLLRERAAARAMPAATYVSILVRTHLRNVVPIPDRELSALRTAVNELSAVGRNLNAMARLLHQDGRQPGPGRDELHTMLRVCEGLRDHFRAVIKVNVISWEAGCVERSQ
jgi:predicted DNA binding CopG/RHH family protein